MAYRNGGANSNWGVNVSKKYHTLVITGDLKHHPREVVIDGLIYEVSASAEGHSLAEMEPLQSLITSVTHMEYEDVVTEAFVKIADETLACSIRQRENSYDEQ